MKTNKRGFTLVELLATIIVLGVIALIATPIVLNVIEESEKSAAERSTENYIRAVETAAAVEKMEGNPLQGKYRILENGNLCPDGTTCTDETDIDIEADRNRPSSGIIYISNERVTKDFVVTMGEYNVRYDYHNKLVALKDGEIILPILLDICTYKGTDASKKYALGAEYECDPGDGRKRTFYVLEDGDTTKLTKTDGSIHYAEDKVGTAKKGQISLIMGNDIGQSPYITNDEYWIACGSNCDYDSANSRFGPITANNYLKRQTTDKGWKTEVYLPTYDQIYAVNNSTSLSSTSWLTSNSIQSGYWVSTSYKNASGIGDVYLVITADGINMLGAGFAHTTETHDIRPVITVAKK